MQQPGVITSSTKYLQSVNVIFKMKCYSVNYSTLFLFTGKVPNTIERPALLTGCSLPQNIAETAYLRTN